MLVLLSFLYHMLSVRVVSAACYDIHFNLNTHPDAQPCNNIVGRISMCCDTNRSTSDLPYTPDTCLPNGLCKNVVTDSANDVTTKYWREGCSDSGWNSQYCLKGICTSSSDVDGSNDALMTPCDGTETSAKWCCGYQNTDCCGTSQEIVLAADLGSATTSSASSTASKTITSTSSMTFTSTPSPSSSTMPPNSLSTGAKAGIGIGSVALAVLVVGAILSFFFLKRKSSRAGGAAAAIDTGYWYQDESKIELQSIPQYQHQLYEMRGDPRSPGTHGELA